MKLSHLIQSIPGIDSPDAADIDITFLTCDSRQVVAGTLFFALRGATVDGHDYIPQAIAAGAAAIVAEQPTLTAAVPEIVVPDGRLAMARMAACFNNDPTASRPLIGITGTNGKTTTTYLIEAILAAAGIRSAVLGTIAYRCGSTIIPASHTTPESTELQSAFRQLVESGAEAFVMEVSSHALEQKRVDGSHFDVAIFSNLTRDHLDYHLTMEHYLDAKARLFSELMIPDQCKPERHAVINMDDQYGASMAARAACPVLSYGGSPENDIYPVEVELSVRGISGCLHTPYGEFPFASKLLGRFNLSNLLAAVAAGVALKLPLQAIKAGIEGHATVPGRMERVENSHGITCLVDYAHTGDALQNVLTTIKEIATGRIITVFGCGGDRDNGKRPIMGAIAARMSDLAIVTSDNPRTEDPFVILQQVKAGITPLGLREYQAEELAAGDKACGYTVLEDRRGAIRLAIKLAQPGDIVLLAGKGHEDYQIIGTTKHHFDDREEAAAAFRERTP